MTPIVLPTNGYRGIGRRHTSLDLARSQGKLSYVGAQTTQRCQGSLSGDRLEKKNGVNNISASLVLHGMKPAAMARMTASTCAASATPMAARSVDQPTALSWPPERPSLSPQAPYPAVHTSDTTSTSLA
jgi:hypothetical protein